MAEFAYNNKFHTAIKTTPFYANLGCHPCFDLKQTPGHFKVPTARKLVADMMSVWKWIRHNIQSANKKYAKYANLKRKDMTTKVKVGDKVWLSSKNIRSQRPSAKLDHKFLGPFKVIAVANHGLNVKLKLPPTMRIHNNFHVNLIKKYVENRFKARYDEVAPPIIVNGVEEYEVEEILDSKLYYHRPVFLVKFKGYDEAENEWCPLDAVQNSSDLLLNYFSKFPGKPGRAEFNKRRLELGTFEDTPGEEADIRSTDITPS